MSIYLKIIAAVSMLYHELPHLKYMMTSFLFKSSVYFRKEPIRVSYFPVFIIIAFDVHCDYTENQRAQNPPCQLIVENCKD